MCQHAATCSTWQHAWTCSKLPLNPKCLKVAQIYAELCDDGSEVKIDVLRQTKGSH